MPLLRNSDNEALQPGSAFAVLFMFCVISVTALMAYIPASCQIAFRDLTILVTKALGTVLGFAMTSNADILTVNGFAMRIINQCTAVDYVAILATAILLYTRHSLSYRLFGLAVAVPAVVFANACRLLISGVVGTFSRRAFDFAHDYLWVIGFALIVFALWTLWVNGRFFVSRSAAWRVGLTVVSTIGVYGLILFCHDVYGDLMAQASSFFYRLMNDDPLASIIRDGDVMVYSRPGASIVLEYMLEQVNIALYVGLMVPLQKKGDWEMLGITIIGLLCVVLLNAIFIALGCRFAVTSGEAGLINFQGIGSVVHMALPMTMYWILTSERREAAV
ncbi:archaeosortase/exosortase family protein [Geomonas azotofigens]|uniref:archaeosortase/exosortase family protein n=1 Tax=Geomonas azotofigens TaxID=2843196 RepID=UPI001C0F5F35|nr:archaeosortase/exosortase family protein [Geomonas azotofigens]MBU5614089.1 hypothetical protein [Geomonas azotofigens]